VRGNRKYNRKAGAFADLAFDGQLAVIPKYKIMADPESDTGTSFIESAFLTGSESVFKDLSDRAFVHSCSGITNSKNDLMTFFL